MMSADSIDNSCNSSPVESHWFAVRVFFNRTDEVLRISRQLGADTYIPTAIRQIPNRAGGYSSRSVAVLPGIIFINCPSSVIRRLAVDLKGISAVITNPGSNLPAAIPDHEMTLFRLVIDSDPNLQLLGDDNPRWHVGQFVKVTSGPLRGAIGHICRIRGDRRLVVTISGVCAVATGYIPARLLQPVDS